MRLGRNFRGEVRAFASYTLLRKFLQDKKKWVTQSELTVKRGRDTQKFKGKIAGGNSEHLRVGFCYVKREGYDDIMKRSRNKIHYANVH